MASDILGAALRYHADGFPVLPIMKNKQPYVKWEGYQQRWLETGQTEEDVRYLIDAPEVPRWGIGVLMYPYSKVVALDFDGPHSDDLWQKTGIVLPPTARNFSASGYPHLFFSVPHPAPDGLQRAVRLVREDSLCGWKTNKGCGIDLIINGYVIVPPSPGYAGDPAHPFASFAEIPIEVLQLALGRKQTGQSKKDKAPSDWVARALAGPVPRGERNEVGTQLVGHWIGLGLPVEEILVLVNQWGKTACVPPLDGHEMGKLVDAVKRFAAQRQRRQSPVEGEYFTQLWSAGQLLRHHGDQVRYCDKFGKWYVWNERYWKEDSRLVIIEKATDTIISIYQEAGEEEDSRRRRALAEYAVRLESHGNIKAMVSLAKPGVAVEPEDFDRDGWIFNCLNGTIDLRTGKLKPQNKEDLITRCSPVPYDPQATSKGFETFLDQIMGNDGDKVRYLQKILGYSLTADVREDAFFIFWGSGANGKSTLISIVMWVLGEYAKVAAPDLFVVKRHETHSTDYADLFRARFVSVMETEEGQRLNLGKIKVHTGRDLIKARFLYQDYFTFTPTYKVVFCTNHRPVIRETTTAAWRRIFLIPFTVEILRDKQDKQLGEKLKIEGPGILRWLVEGCLAWQRDGLAPPEAVRTATEEYRAESDVVGQFLEDRCVLSAAASVTRAELYDAYCKWSEEKPLSTKGFAERLRARGIVDGHSHGRRIWKGVGLRPEEGK